MLWLLSVQACTVEGPCAVTWHPYGSASVLAGTRMQFGWQMRPAYMLCIRYHVHGKSVALTRLLCHCRHDVFGVFMRNWDESEEQSNDNCSIEADFAQAQSVCRHIGIPLHEVNFVRQYWTQVFSDFLAQVSRIRTACKCSTKCEGHSATGLAGLQDIGLCARLVRLCAGSAVRGGRDSQS